MDDPFEEEEAWEREYAAWEAERSAPVPREDEPIRWQVCSACGGSALSPYPWDGGSCPHCFGGRVRR